MTCCNKSEEIAHINHDHECGYSEVDGIALLAYPPQYVNAQYVRDL